MPGNIGIERLPSCNVLQNEFIANTLFLDMPCVKKVYRDK